MQTVLDIAGASGAVYRFRLWPAGAMHSPMASNFVFVRLSEGKFEIVYSGERSHFALTHDTWPEWNRARNDFGATHVYTRLNISEATRQQEMADIVEAYHPPMNEGA